MFQEMRLCSIIHRAPRFIGYQRHSKTLDSFNILDMASTQGVKAAGFGAKTGAIEIGANAGLILVNMKKASHSLNPMVPMEIVVIGCAKGSYVDTVIIGGGRYKRQKID